MPTPTEQNDPQNRTGSKKIAVLGSSGGNLRSHGGGDPAGMLKDIAVQLDAAGFELARAVFVSADATMDGIGPHAAAQLWVLQDGSFTAVSRGSLADINELARVEDNRVAGEIRAGRIDGLIVMSADPDGVNAASISAAVESSIPVAGTGGTSIAKAQALGANLVAASGTTGTTSTTRAVSYVAGLARHWKVRYRPDLGGTGSRGAAAAGTQSLWRRISIRGIMVGSIPAFISLALVLAVSRIPVLSGLSEVFDLLIAGLPVVVAAVAARKVSGLDEVGIVAGATAGVLSVSGGILGGLVGGILAGLLATVLIQWTLAHRFPATTANIVTGALAGLLPGLLVFYVLAPVTTAAGDGVKAGIEAALEFSPLLAGAVAGAVIWPAIIGGVYHSVILPLVLVEMAQKGHSFFGAIDMVALVMVSLGITLANTVAPRSTGERALAGSGAAVNFFFGTFVEASYPFMFGDKRVFAIAILSGAAGGAVVGATATEATAYLPAVLAPFIATSAAGMVASMATGFGLAFLLTLVANQRHTRRTRRAPASEPVAAQ